jgi:hypothetical protein
MSRSPERVVPADRRQLTNATAGQLTSLVPFSASIIQRDIHFREDRC